MAWELPQSCFVGIDLARKPVEAGQRMAAELGLCNIRLVQGDIREVGPDWGTFDYVIAHGLYSWVPAPVQTHLLRICQQCLAPHGIAFISYNALPGCHLRNMLREMMRFHVRAFEAAEEQVHQAKALVRFLADAQDSRDEYRLWMKAELDRVIEQDPAHLYHDDLAEVNTALYFTQFMEQASRQGLQYLAEADYFEMSDHIFKPSVRETLAELSANRILREQYLDFLKCRRFRQTLLCPAGAAPSAQPGADAIAHFRVSSPARPTGTDTDLRPGCTCVFTTPRGARVETDFSLGKAALVELGPCWPMPRAFEDLHEAVRNRLAAAGLPVEAPSDTRASLIGFLESLYAAGAVEFRTYPPPVSSRPGQRPLASPVARWQVRHGEFVTTALHQAVRVEDEIGRCLLSQLDGSKDRSVLMKVVWELLRSRDAIKERGRSEADIRRTIETELESNLQKLAKLGLLIDEQFRL